MNSKRLLVYYLIELYIFCSMFSNAFAITGMLCISFFISLIIATHFIFSNQIIYISKLMFKGNMSLLIYGILLLCGYLAFSTGDKCTNHLLMLTIPLFSYYFVMKNEISNLYSEDLIKKQLFKIVALSVLFASFFCIIEYICKNFIGLNIDLFIPRGSVEEMDAISDGRLRARSFTEEPGHFALYMEILSPIAFYWFSNNIRSNIIKVSIYVSIFAGFFLTFSASGYVILLIAMLIILYFNGINITVLKYLFGCILVLLLISMFYPNLTDSFISVIENKLDSSNSSNTDRMSRMQALDYFSGLHIWFGYGPAAFSTLHTKSFVSLYLGMLMNTGIIGLLVFISFLMYQYKLVFSLREKKMKITFLLSLTLPIIHFTFVDIIYYPWFWIPLSLLYALVKKQNAHKIHTYRKSVDWLFLWHQFIKSK